MPLMHEYSDILSDKPCVAKVDSHRDALTSDIPVFVKLCSVPIRLMKPDKKIEDMEEAGVFERSTSSYCNPMVAVSKKDGHVHIRDIYCRLSAITRFTAKPILNTRVVFAWLAGSKFVTKQDLTKGYFQVPLEEERKRVTAFSKPWGLFLLDL